MNFSALEISLTTEIVMGALLRLDCGAYMPQPNCRLPAEYLSTVRAV
jgi:hypothetical protein